MQDIYVCVRVRTSLHRAWVQDSASSDSSCSPTGVPTSFSPKTTMRKPPATSSSVWLPMEDQTLWGMAERAPSVMRWGRSLTKTMRAKRMPARFSRTRGPPRTPLLKKKPSSDWKQRLPRTVSTKPACEAILLSSSCAFSILVQTRTFLIGVDVYLFPWERKKKKRKINGSKKENKKKDVGLTLMKG